MSSYSVWQGVSILTYNSSQRVLVSCTVHRPVQILVLFIVRNPHPYAWLLIACTPLLQLCRPDPGVLQVLHHLIGKTCAFSMGHMHITKAVQAVNYLEAWPEHQKSANYQYIGLLILCTGSSSKWSGLTVQCNNFFNSPNTFSALSYPMHSFHFHINSYCRIVLVTG